MNIIAEKNKKSILSRRYLDYFRKPASSRAGHGKRGFFMQNSASDANDTRLVALARQARENAYAPYSHFRVGAALLCEDGTVFTGCNVENVSFGATICAERAAVAAAVTAGKTRFAVLCVAVDGEPVTPCGICRQVLCEFAPGLKIICAGTDKITETTLGSLFPQAFDSFEPQTPGASNK